MQRDKNTTKLESTTNPVTKPDQPIDESARSHKHMRGGCRKRNTFNRNVTSVRSIRLLTSRFLMWSNKIRLVGQGEKNKNKNKTAAQAFVSYYVISLQLFYHVCIMSNNWIIQIFPFQLSQKVALHQYQVSGCLRSYPRFSTSKWIRFALDL